MVLKENTKDIIQELKWMSLNWIWMSDLYLFLFFSFNMEYIMIFNYNFDYLSIHFEGISVWMYSLQILCWGIKLFVYNYQLDCLIWLKN